MHGSRENASFSREPFYGVSVCMNKGFQAADCPSPMVSVRAGGQRK